MRRASSKESILIVSRLGECLSHLQVYTHPYLLEGFPDRVPLSLFLALGTTETYIVHEATKEDQGCEDLGGVLQLGIRYERALDARSRAASEWWEMCI